MRAHGSSTETAAGVPAARRAYGPRAVEALLLADLDTRLGAARADRAHADRAPADTAPGDAFARVLHVVVPSASAREHVARRLVARAPRGALFARVLTLHACALDVLDRAGQRCPRGDLLLPVLVREGLRALPGLARFRAFEEPERALVPCVTDLLDAGFEPRDLEPCLEALAAAAHLSPEVRALAQDVVRLAARVAAEQAAHELGGPARCARLAAEALRADRGLAPAGDVWIHGFSDATGSALELLEALVSRANAVVYHDDCASGPFGALLRERLGLHGPFAAPSPGGALELACAPDQGSEVRAVLDQLRAAIERGTAPEDLGVTARDLAAYRGSIAVHFARAGIPFHAPSLERGPAGPERRARALAGLLERGERARLERWFDARGVPIEREIDLAVGSRVLGVRTIAELAALDLDERLAGAAGLQLPVRGAGEADASRLDDAPERDGDDEDDEDLDGEAEGGIDEPVPRRVLPRECLASARAEARALVRAFDAGPDVRPAADWLAALDALARTVLCVDRDAATLELWSAAQEQVAAEVPGARPVGAREARGLVAAALRAQARTALGGRGAGVAVMSASEARGRTFARLHVLGVEHGVFPRSVRPEPVLPEDARAVLRELLPALPDKRVGHDEEHVLFEQFVRAAPEVSMSYRARDDSGRLLAPSAFLERVRAAAGAARPDGAADAVGAHAVVRTLARLHARRADPCPEPRTAHEHAIDAALALGHAGFAALAEVALGSAARAGGDRSAEPEPSAPAPARRFQALAEARARTLAELEPAPALASSPGPFLGFLGARAERAGTLPITLPLTLAVTRLERYADCAWREFLEKSLAISPSIDPLADLPALRGRVLGNLVHSILEEPYAHGPHELATLLDPAREALVARALPELEEGLEERLEAVARRILAAEGCLLPGLARLLAARARAYVLRAHELDQETASDGPVQVLGVEVTGDVRVARAGAPDFVLTFRADRVERHAGTIVLVDFKTGAPFVTTVTEAKRREHVEAATASGLHLQALAYALGAGGGAAGEYRHLAPDLDERTRRIHYSSSDTPLADSFRATVARLVEARALGAHPPRLVDPRTEKEPRACAICEFALACSRGDSAVRRRIVRLVEAAKPGAAPGEPDAARTAVAAWRGLIAAPDSPPTAPQSGARP